ncbi:MAG: hypothetical protein P8Q42_03105, partial [Flavobacteriales bacterium]|nr:hypothetical protein [Flavobacteriales bacterium]
MKKSTYLIALALGASTISLAQNVGINTDGSDPDTDALLHLLNTNSTALDPLIRLENQQGASVNGIELLNSGGATAAEWDLYIPSSTTDFRVSNGTTDHVTIQNDGDVGIGTTSPTGRLHVHGDGVADGGIITRFTSDDNRPFDILSPVAGDLTSPFQLYTLNAFEFLVLEPAGALSTLNIEADADVRIESDDNANMLFVDYSADAVGIGTTSPASTIDIQGSMGLKVTTITSATTLDQTHNVVLCNTGSYTVTLPAAASNTGKVYYIKNIDSDGDYFTIDGNSTETIDGDETFELLAYNHAVRIISDGSGWHVINEVGKENKDISGCGTYFTFTWQDVTNPSTGLTWMDRNLGAQRVALSSTDDKAYGDLYQWGRSADGHQCRTSSTTATNASDETPGDALFIYETSSPYDWLTTQNDNLWQGVDGTNNPCPGGYRLPTETEL